MLKGLAHPNIYPVLGACSDEEGPPMVMYPYTQEGNMKKFLQKCRMSECGSRYVSCFGIVIIAHIIVLIVLLLLIISVRIHVVF